jgi:Mg2+-importing ATPase
MDSPTLPRFRHSTHGADAARLPSHAPELVALSGLSVEDCCKNLNSSSLGLAADEAGVRLESYGPNLVTRERKPTILRKSGAAPKSAQRLAADLGGVVVFPGDVRAAVVIALMVLLAITTAFIQEHRSNEAAAKLRAMVETTASVKRCTLAGHCEFVEVPVETVVPGDIVRLSAGDMIASDLRLIEAKDLFINQSALTGEALPAEKFAHAWEHQTDDPFDLPNMCFMGANVVSGFATGVIVRTGAHTFFGQLADEIAGRRVPTAFDRGIDRFTWLMIRFIVVMVPTVFLISGLTKHDWLEALLFAAVAGRPQPLKCCR